MGLLDNYVDCFRGSMVRETVLCDSGYCTIDADVSEQRGSGEIKISVSNAAGRSIGRRRGLSSWKHCMYPWTVSVRVWSVSDLP